MSIGALVTSLSAASALAFAVCWFKACKQQAQRKAEGLPATIEAITDSSAEVNHLQAAQVQQEVSNEEVVVAVPLDA